MAHETLTLPADPNQALQTLREASVTRPVIVFKQSPICPVSKSAEFRFRQWLKERKDTPLAVVVIDVIAERPLARGLTAELGIHHESPQALVFRDQELTWHDSHGALAAEAFDAALK